MIRVSPAAILGHLPGSIIAVACASGGDWSDSNAFYESTKKSKQPELSAVNSFIRENIDIRRRIDYRKDERPMLKDLHLNGRAIVSACGNYIYVDHERYWAYVNSEYGLVDVIWIIRNPDEEA